MPDLSIPEVRLRDKLPKGLRTMTLDDIQKAIPDVRLPAIDVSGIDLAGDVEKAARSAEKVSRKARKSAAREAAKAAKAVEKALPARSTGPNPVAIGILAMIGGLVVGWILATNPSTGPRVSAWLEDLRLKFEEWRGAGFRELDDEEWDTTDPVAYPESLRAPIAPEPYSDTLSTAETGVGVGPGQLPEGMGTDDPAEVGAADRLGSSERI